MGWRCPPEFLSLIQGRAAFGESLISRPFRRLPWEVVAMTKLLLWCLLFVVCWPLALGVLIVYPLVWLCLLPFRLVGMAVDAVFDSLHAVLTLPARLLNGI